MSADLMILHVLFILACAGGSWFFGWNQGKRDVINMFIDDGITTSEELIKKYASKD
tara:strand:- start:1120 stop:1287 length:168 start_codon:yes stop_codon:yes gene_type:complete